MNTSDSLKRSISRSSDRSFDLYYQIHNIRCLGKAYHCTPNKWRYIARKNILPRCDSVCRRNNLRCDKLNRVAHFLSFGRNDEDHSPRLRFHTRENKIQTLRTKIQGRNHQPHYSYTNMHFHSIEGWNYIVLHRTRNKPSPEPQGARHIPKRKGLS